MMMIFMMIMIIMSMMMIILMMIMIVSMMITMTNLHIPGCRDDMKVEGLDHNVDAVRRKFHH